MGCQAKSDPGLHRRGKRTRKVPPLVASCLDVVAGAIACILHMFRFGRRQSTKAQIAAIAGITSSKKLRNLAYNSTDEHVRLKAAKHLKDTQILGQLALCASQETVRLEAAQAVGDQAALAALALKAWDISLGLKAVDHIRNTLLLKRVAHSARQDRIRLAAAQQLNDQKLLISIGRSTRDIHVRWEVARNLEDLLLIAEVALFKPANNRLASLRHQAHRVLLQALDKLAQQHHYSALRAFIRNQPHTPYKIEAFLRLPAHEMRSDELACIARQNFHYTSIQQIDALLTSIRNAGWRLSFEDTFFPCIQCGGKGIELRRIINGLGHPANADAVTCSECDGQRGTLFKVATCLLGSDATVVFKLPSHQ